MFPYCTYLEQGQALAAEMREIFYTSDTQNLFTVLSMNREENFALSYDVTHVTKHTDPLETTTLKAAVDFSLQMPMPYKFRRGISIFNVIRTEDVDGGTVDTWLNTVTTETSQFDGTGGCCMTEVRDIDGNVMTAKTTLMTQCNQPANKDNNWWTTKIQPPTSFTTITVEDPIHPLTIFALYGGWMAFMKMVVYAIFEVYKCARGEDDDPDSTPKSRQAVAQREVENGGNGEVEIVY
jgi:hypothetical protein